jgi:hypothetical protein
LVEILAAVFEPAIPRGVHAINQCDGSGIRKRMETSRVATVVIVGPRVTTDGAVVIGTGGVIAVENASAGCQQRQPSRLYHYVIHAVLYALPDSTGKGG